MTKEDGDSGRISKERDTENVRHRSEAGIGGERNQIGPALRMSTTAKGHRAAIRSPGIALAGIGQILLIIFATLSILQYPVAYNVMTKPPFDIVFSLLTPLVVESIVAFAVFFVFVIMTFLTTRMSQAPGSRRPSIVAAFFGCVATALGIIYYLIGPGLFPLAITWIQHDTYYGNTIPGAISASIVGPLIGVTLASIGTSLMALHKHESTTVIWTATGIIYMISGIFLIGSILASLWSPVAGLNLVLIGSLVMLASGIIGAMAFIGERTKRRGT